MTDPSNDAAIQLQNLGFPPVFAAISVGDIPRTLRAIAQQPKRFFKLLPKLAARLPGIAGWIPLWEENREAVVAYDTSGKTYLRCNYGDATAEHLGATYQQFVTAVLAECVYAGLNDHLGELSSLFEYRHLERLREWAAVDDDLDAQESKRRLVESITE